MKEMTKVISKIEKKTKIGKCIMKNNRHNVKKEKVDKR